jgi:hypothetical protein
MVTLRELFEIEDKDLTEPEQVELNTDYELYCDLDGVLSDFEGQFEKYTGQSPDEYEERYGKTPFWNLIASIGEIYWSKMPMMPQGQLLWDYIKKYKPTILSSPSREQHSKTGKSIWVNSHLDPVSKLIFARAEQKSQYSGKNKILIDDRPDTISRWTQAGGIGILCKDGNSRDVIDKLTKLGL